MDYEPKSRIKISQLLEFMLRQNDLLSEHELIYNLEKSLVFVELKFQDEDFYLKKKITDINYDNFLIFELIGKGECGSVYKSYDKTLKKFVALKFVHIALKKKQFENCCTEASILKELSDNNSDKFLKFYDVYKDDSKIHLKQVTIIFSMELGIADLFQINMKRMKYSSKEIFYLMFDIIESLLIARQMHIFNGDLKLADIILVQSMNSFRYKIIDFGMGDMLNDSKKLILGNEVKGMSELYAAPEILNLVNEKENTVMKIMIDPFKVDIYSLGIIILKMMGCTQKHIIRIKNNQKELSRLEKEYPKICKILPMILKVNPEERISYENLLTLIKKEEKSMPKEELFLNSLKENQAENLSELEIEKYVELFSSLNEFNEVKKYVYIGLNNQRKHSNNSNREAFWLEKCGDAEF